MLMTEEKMKIALGRAASGNGKKGAGFVFGMRMLPGWGGPLSRGQGKKKRRGKGWRQTASVQGSTRVVVGRKLGSSVDGCFLTKKKSVILTYQCGKQQLEEPISGLLKVCGRYPNSYPGAWGERRKSS